MEKQEFSFFGSNVYEWKTSDNVNEVIAWFEKQKIAYSLFYVPVPNDANYEINFYCPQVEGAVYLGSYKNKKIVVSK